MGLEHCLAHGTSEFGFCYCHRGKKPLLICIADWHSEACQGIVCQVLEMMHTYRVSIGTHTHTTLNSTFGYPICEDLLLFLPRYTENLTIMFLCFSYLIEQLLKRKLLKWGLRL